jgi:2,3-bisphosphoglycerate-dependent phosphoglycerate mutase
MPELVLLRHGQSIFNLEGRFTGWMDVDLSDAGRDEARAAGRTLKENGYRFDKAYTSMLKRAIRTLWIALDEMEIMWTPICCSWRLNERSYGAFQGMKKQEAVQKYGEEQVHKWRRGYSQRPPALEDADPRHPVHDPRYAMLRKECLPGTESLEDTLVRVLSIWQGEIAPELKRGNRVFISSHGNTLRALVKHLDDISSLDIESFEIPTGVPLVYELDEDLRPLDRFYLRKGEECQRNIGL